MGTIKRPIDDWDKRRNLERPKRLKVVNKCYIGFDHYYAHWNDGTVELVSSNTRSSALFYAVGRYTDDGYPILE